MIPDARARGNERILLWLTADPATAILIRRGRGVGDYLQSECMAIAVSNNGHRPKSAQASTRQNRITQSFMTRNVPDLHKLVRIVRDMQVSIMAERVR